VQAKIKHQHAAEPVMGFRRLGRRGGVSSPLEKKRIKKTCLNLSYSERGAKKEGISALWARFWGVQERERVDCTKGAGIATGEDSQRITVMSGPARVCRRPIKNSSREDRRYYGM